jgi:hypothetical protein
MLRKNVLNLVLLAMSTLFLFYSCQTSNDKNELEDLKKENTEIRQLAKSALDAFKTPWERFLDGPDELLPPPDINPIPLPPLTPCEEQCVEARKEFEKTCREIYLNNVETRDAATFHLCMTTAVYNFKKCFTNCLREEFGDDDFFFPDQAIKRTDN